MGGVLVQINVVAGVYLSFIGGDNVGGYKTRPYGLRNPRNGKKSEGLAMTTPFVSLRGTIVPKQSPLRGVKESLLSRC